MSESELGLMASVFSQELQWQHRHCQGCSIRESYLPMYRSVCQTIPCFLQSCPSKSFTQISRSSLTLAETLMSSPFRSHFLAVVVRSWPIHQCYLSNLLHQLNCIMYVHHADYLSTPFWIYKVEVQLVWDSIANVFKIIAFTEYGVWMSSWVTSLNVKMFLWPEALRLKATLLCAHVPTVVTLTVQTFSLPVQHCCMFIATGRIQDAYLPSCNETDYIKNDRLKNIFFLCIV